MIGPFFVPPRVSVVYRGDPPPIVVLASAIGHGPIAAGASQRAAGAPLCGAYRAKAHLHLQMFWVSLCLPRKPILVHMTAITDRFEAGTYLRIVAKPIWCAAIGAAAQEGAATFTL